MIGKRLFLFCIIWLVLTEGSVSDPVIALLGICAATAASVLLWPRPALRVRWRGFPGFISYFLVASVRGGFDIARRAFSPAMPVQPAFLSYESSLSGEAGRVLFVWTISLMPGTASVKLERGRELTVHVVDRKRYNAADLRRLEERVAGLIL